MVEVRVLGDIEIVDEEGSVLPVTADAPRRVLAHLAIVAPGLAWSDALVEGIWPDDPPPSHRAALRNTVSRLRRLLGDAGGDPILRRETGYQLASSISIDAVALESAVSAARGVERPARLVELLDPVVDLWRGPAYGDLADEPFAPERVRLSSIQLEAVETHQRALIALGRSAEGLGRLNRALADHPFSEILVELVMLTHYLAGRQAEALGAYERIRRDLGEQLGLVPSPRLSAIQVSVLRHRPIAEVLAAGHQPYPTGTLTPIPSALVGQAVAATLSAPWGLAADGAVADGPMAAGRQRAELLQRRGDSSAHLGNFDDAAADYLAAVDEAKRAGDTDGVGRLCLRLATVTWDPERAGRVAALIDEALQVVDNDVLAAELRICRAGGLFRSGVEAVLDPDPARLADDLDRVRERGSATEIAWAVTRHRNGLAGLIPPEASLDLTAEVEALRPIDRLIVGHTERARFVDSLRAGRPAAAAAALRAMQRNDPDAEPVVNRFGVIAASTCWNLAVGRLDEARRGLADAATHRGQLGRHTLDQVVLGQSFWLTRELGDEAAIEAHLDAAVDLASGDRSTPLWAVGASLLAADLGRFDTAAAILADADSVFGLDDLPAGSHRLPIQALAAETLSAIGDRADRGLAERLRRRIEEATERGVLVGWPVIFLGSTQRFLAFAAHAAGDLDTAADHAARAVREDRWLPALRARSLVAAAGLSSGPEARALEDRAATIRRRLLQRMDG